MIWLINSPISKEIKQYIIKTVPIRNVIDINSPSMFHDLACLCKLRCLTIYLNDEWDDWYRKAFNQCLSKLVSLQLLEVDEGSLNYSLSWILSYGPQLLNFNYEGGRWPTRIRGHLSLTIEIRKLSSN